MGSCTSAADIPDRLNTLSARMDEMSKKLDGMDQLNQSIIAQLESIKNNDQAVNSALTDIGKVCSSLAAQYNTVAVFGNQLRAALICDEKRIGRLEATVFGVATHGSPAAEVSSIPAELPGSGCAAGGSAGAEAKDQSASTGASTATAASAAASDAKK